jgi:hypothetical protein
MQFYKKHFIPGDFLIINSNAHFPYWYYVSQLDIDHRTSEKKIALVDGTLIEAYRVGQLLDALQTDATGIQYTKFRYIFFVFDENGRGRKLLSLARENKEYPVLKNSSLGFINQNRVWLFLSHMPEKEHDFILSVFDRNRTRRKTIERNGAALYLFEKTR